MLSTMPPPTDGNSNSWYGTGEEGDGFLARSGFFAGWTRLTWLVVALQALGGLLVALVMLVADNVVKNFASSVSILVSMGASHLLFGGRQGTDGEGGNLMLGVSLVMVSVWLYHTGQAKKMEDRSPLAGHDMEKGVKD